MTSIQEESPIVRSSRKELFNAKISTVGTVLGVAAIASAIGQRSSYYWGAGHQLPEAVVMAMNSSAHPFVGFIGAAVGAKAVERLTKNKSERNMALVVGAATANFYTEAAQQVILKSTSENYFWNMPRETAKDYLFALGGAGLYALLRKSS